MGTLGVYLDDEHTLQLAALAQKRGIKPARYAQYAILSAMEKDMDRFFPRQELERAIEQVREEEHVKALMAAMPQQRQLGAGVRV